jgi:hypothetical protein
VFHVSLNKNEKWLTETVPTGVLARPSSTLNV